MADPIDLDKLPQATVVPKKRMRFSIVWIIPLLAALVAIGIAIQRIRSEGPAITIVFKTAQGIEAGKSFIKYKDVNIGQVTAVELSDDYAKVLVRAKIAKHAAGLMVQDAKFWVVEPRISLSGISGLSTLLSGNYIGFQAGKSGEDERDFIGLDEPPAIADQPGRRFVLRASSLGSLGVGAPVYYRQLAVGKVAAYNLAADGKSVEITIFVDAPYDKYVTTGTRFWNASGIDVSVGAEGVDVRTESLVALLAGGLAFDAPGFLPPGDLAAANARFTLYRNREIAMKQPDPIERRFVLYFDESVRGLSIGAPVTLFGLTVGEVADVGLSIDPATQAVRPRVLITFFPERLIGRVSTQEQAAAKSLVEANAEARMRNMRRQVEGLGMRAQLQSGSLLTGQLYIGFGYFPNAPKVKLDLSKDPIELPVVPGGLANIEAKLTSILGKIDSMPLNAIGIDVKNALETLNRTLKDADTLISRVDAQWVPEGTKTLEDLRRAIASADRALKNADAALFAGDSPAPQDLRDTLQEVTRAARAVRVLVDYLERHPETLIRNKPQEKP
ncbi:MAG TPA: MlaD family protein [Casimicrobiaceae bacterium]|jgi:paraquat-inducible protein B|nr:MlaD family protein [Casimicrobiaceae bacterium]